jgi:lysozyme
MRISDKGLELIKHFEGLYLESYLCPAGKWTIGYGTTYYPDGSLVAKGETCTKEEAEQFLRTNLIEFEECVDKLVEFELEQHQFDALVSFAYNLGCASLKRSTLLKIINVNPNLPTITAEFNKWVNAGGRRLEGLVKRRAAESHLYATGELKFE